MDQKGVAASIGSACSTATLEPSACTARNWIIARDRARLVQDNNRQGYN